MSYSINTNAGAMIALTNLSKTNSELSITQNRISTGLRVNTAKDDAASYAIASRMRGDVSAYESVVTGLGLGDATLGVAINAGTQISSLLEEMKSKAVQAQAGGLSTSDRTAINNDVAKLVEQVDTIVASAEFNGQNLIANGATNIDVIASKDAAQKITMAAQSFDKADLGINALDLTTATNAATALTAVDAAINTAANSLASFGSVGKQLDIQTEFTKSLLDSVEVGIGKLVDADMAKESAKLQSLQIKQQLGVQSLGIANQSSSIILGMFS